MKSDVHGRSFLPARLPLRIELKKSYMCGCGFVGGPEDAYHSTEFMRRTGCELACRACIDASLGPLGGGRYLSLRDMVRLLERLDRGGPATVAPR